MQSAVMALLGRWRPALEAGDGTHVPDYCRHSAPGESHVTLQIRETGMLLNVRSMLAFTPGGGSNTKMRPARSRFTGT